MSCEKTLGPLWAIAAYRPLAVVGKMQMLRQLDVHPKVREEADILVRTFSGAIGKHSVLCRDTEQRR